MRVSRLYTSAPLATGKLIELDDDNGHYVRTVLRLKKTPTSFYLTATAENIYAPLPKSAEKPC